MAVTRWVFTDSTVPESWTFTYNPISGGSLERRKNISTSSTTGPSGSTIIFEGASNPLESEIQGFCLTQAHFEELERWYNKSVPIQLDDDLGRSYSIYITEFSPSRERAVHSPWKHSFRMKWIVLEEL